MPSKHPVAGHADAAYLVRRGGIWQFRRRVPDTLQALDRRREVRLSTGTGDRTQAALAAAHFNAALEAHWASLGTNQPTSPDSATRFSAAVDTARKLGLKYQPADALAEAGLVDLVARVELIDKPAAAAPVVTAVLGGAELKLSGIVDAFARIAADRLIGKSADQLRKWKNPLLRAVENLTELIGDKRIADIHARRRPRLQALVGRARARRGPMIAARPIRTSATSPA